jgi:flagellin
MGVVNSRDVLTTATMIVADVQILKGGASDLSVTIGSQSMAVDMTSVTDETSLVSAINAAANGLGITATIAGAGTTATINFSGEITGTVNTMVVNGSGVTGFTSAAAATTNERHADDIDISSVAGTAEALEVIDNALLEISDSRANLGAVQNRFSHTIGNLANIQENVSASRSRIQDTDFAAETAHMTKNQILQQAGTSILAQANQVPQAALSLLG